MTSSTFDNTQTISVKPEQLDLLRAMTPAFISLEALNKQLAYFSSQPDNKPPHRFDNAVLFDTDVYRTRILDNVDAILDTYSDDSVPLTKKDTKHLLWSALQLYARLQAIESDVGVILEPNTEYLKRQKQLAKCRDLLTQQQIDITSLLNFKPLIPAQTLLTGSHSEKWFEWFIDQIDRRNDTRLYWVWGRGELDQILGYLSQAEAQQRLADSSYIPGQISWSLYFLRGSIFFYKYMQKRYQDPSWVQALQGLSEQERQAYLKAYHKAYWDLYKYRILNDAVWGPINLASFAYLVGDGWYGWFGDFATCFLLGMDVYLSGLQCDESEKKYQTVCEFTEQRYNALTTALYTELHTQSYPNDVLTLLSLQEQINEINAHLTYLPSESLSDWNDIARERASFEQDWQQKKQALNYDRIYTWLLLAAYTISVALLISTHLPVLAVIILKSGGTFLCTALTIAHRTAKVHLDMKHQATLISDLKAQESNYLNQFTSAESDDDAKKQLYRSIKQVGAQLNDAEALIQYKQGELARTSFLRIMIPTLIGLTLVYAPASVLMIPSYVFVLLLSGLLAYALKENEPSKETVSDFSSKAFQLFSAKPESLHTPRVGFFSQLNQRVKHAVPCLELMASL